MKERRRKRERELEERREKVGECGCRYLVERGKVSTGYSVPHGTQHDTDADRGDLKRRDKRSMGV